MTAEIPAGVVHTHAAHGWTDREIAMLSAAEQNSPNCLEEGLHLPAADMYLHLPGIYISCLEEVTMGSPWKGKHLSEEHKKRISSANKGKNIGNTHGFRKGDIPWNKGKSGIYSEEHRRMISLANKGKKLSDEHIKKLRELYSGDNNPAKRPDVRAKISLAHKGKRLSKEHKLKIAPWGRKLSEETKRKIRDHNPKGESHPNWKGGQRLNDARHKAKKRSRGFILLTKHNPYDEPIEYHHIHPNLPYVVPCPTRIHQMFPGGEKTHFQNVNAMLGLSFDFSNLLKNKET